MGNKKNYFQYGKYGMRPADYKYMLVDQGGVCSICKKPPKPGKRLVIDHDHESGEVRGLLCNSCNLTIGHAKDDPIVLRAAADYLDSGGDRSRFYVEGGRLISSFD